MHNAWRQYMGQLITIPDSNEPQGTSSGVYVTVVLRMIQTVHAPNRLRRDVSDCNEMIIDLTGLSGLQMTGPSHRNCINAAYDKNLGHHHLRRLMRYLDHQCAMCMIMFSILCLPHQNSTALSLRYPLVHHVNGEENEYISSCNAAGLLYHDRQKKCFLERGVEVRKEVLHKQNVNARTAGSRCPYSLHNMQQTHRRCHLRAMKKCSPYTGGCIGNSLKTKTKRKCNYNKITDSIEIISHTGSIMMSPTKRPDYQYRSCRVSKNRKCLSTQALSGLHRLLVAPLRAARRRRRHLHPMEEYPELESPPLESPGIPLRDLWGCPLRRPAVGPNR